MKITNIRKLAAWAFSIICLTAASGCAMTVLGVPVDLTVKQKLAELSPYDRRTANFDGGSGPYLEKVRASNRKVVQDEYGTFYNVVEGNVLSQFFVSKPLEARFYQMLAKGTSILSPFHRSNVASGPDRNGVCRLLFAYDGRSTDLWVNKLKNFKMNLRPESVSAKIADEMLKILIERTSGKQPSTAQLTAYDKLFEGANVLISDQSLEGRISSGTKPTSNGWEQIGPCNQLTQASEFLLEFWDMQILTEMAKTPGGYGTPMASCTVIDFDAKRANANGQFVAIERVLKARNALEARASTFCDVAMNELGLTRRITSEKLR
jgi:hypothetical protein